MSGFSTGQKKVRLVVNSVWVILFFALFLLFPNKSLAIRQSATVSFCYLIFIFSIYFLHISYTIPKFLNQKRYGLFVLAVLSSVLISALLRIPLVKFMSIHVFMHNSSPSALSIFKDSFLNISIALVCMLFSRIVLERIQMQQFLRQMEIAKDKTELDFLKAQFNPHFLFNSLHSIYGHIDKNNQSARKMLITFSDMLRYQLYECNENLVDLDREISYIRNYVTLQRARAEENLIVDMEFDESLNSYRIVPLLLIIFVENAFKYVSNFDQQPNWIRIRFSKEPSGLIFQVTNSKENSSHQHENPGGIGIANAKRRLSLSYPDRHEFSIRELPEL
ncbi:MAG TPA: histidine kinase, partial [Puia sp.]|nr:histidine kinase [Puia sp.]